MFEAEDFSVDFFTRAHLGPLSEKGIAMLRSDLLELGSECSEEVRTTVKDHHAGFVAASRGIAGLEDSVRQLKDLLGASYALAASIRETAAPTQLPPRVAPCGAQGASGRSGSSGAACGGSHEEELAGLSGVFVELDLALAERRLREGCAMFKGLQEQLASLSTAPPTECSEEACVEDEGGSAIGASALADCQGLLPTLRAQEATEDRRRTLSTLLGQKIQDPSCSAGSFAESVSLLTEVVGPPAAARRMLEAYSAALRREQMSLLKPFMTGTSSSNTDSVTFSGASARRLCGTVDEALRRHEELFGGCPRLASLFVSWAAREVESYGQLLRRHALAAHSSAGGVQASARCICCALAFCCRIEELHGLCLSPHLLKAVWPALESVIQKRLRRIAEEVKQLVMEEAADGRLHVVARRCGEGLGDPADLPASVRTLIEEVCALLSDVAFTVLNGPPLLRSLRQGIGNLFHLYTSAVARSLRKQRKAAGAPGAVGSTGGVVQLARMAASELEARANASHPGVLGSPCSAADLARHVGELERSLSST